LLTRATSEPLPDVHALLALRQADARALLGPRAPGLPGFLRLLKEGCVSERDRKLAELADIAVGIRHGMAAFDDRLDEMGPGVSARGNGRGSKGVTSSPVESAVEKPAKVVTSHLDRAVDRAHAALLDLDAAYGEIARPRRGLPVQGEPSCAWCAEAVQAAEKVASTELAKRRAKGDELVTLNDLSPVPLDYRSPTYLYAEVRKGDKVVGRQLVCEWCYRFNGRNERKPSIEERWVHIQGGQVHPERANSVRMKAARRMKATAK
jgi:hypothetical protein